MSPKSLPFAKNENFYNLTTVCHNPTNFIGKCTRVLLLLGTLLHIREEEGEKKIYIKNGAACSGANGRWNHWRHRGWSPPNFGLYVHPFLQSVNPQYNTLVCWLAGMQMTCQPSVWFSKHFHDFLQNCLQKSFQFIFLFFINLLRLGAQSVTLLSTLRDPTKFRQRQCACACNTIFEWKKTQILIAPHKERIDQTKKVPLAAKKSSARD